MSACYFKKCVLCSVIWLNCNLYIQDDNNITNNNRENQTVFRDNLINFIWAEVKCAMAEALRKYTLKGICRFGGLDGEHSRQDR